MNQIINNLLVYLNSIGSGFCNHALSMFAQSGVLIILLLIIDYMLRKKVRAVFRYCVWMLVFIKLILPPTLSLPTGIGYWCGSSLSPTKIMSRPIVDSMSTAEAIVPDISEDFAINSKPAQARPFQTTPATIAPVTPAVSNLPPITWQAIVFLIWLVGAIVFSVLLIQRMFFVLGLIAQGEAAKGRLLETLKQCRRQVGIGRNVDLKLSSHIQSPAVCGLFKPIILMPTSLLKELSSDKLRGVLIHELVHIKRFDLWINFAQTFLQIIYFYNPFVWLANSLVRRIREQAVDEAVLVAMGAEAKSYSNTLIDIAEMAFFRTNFSLRLIGVAESKKSLHRRIRHMLTQPIPKNARVGVFRIAIIIVIAAVLLPMARAEKPAESKEPYQVIASAELGTADKPVESDKPVQDVTSAEPGTVEPFVLRIRTFIDGSDYIKIRGDSLWYEHQKWDLPGKWWNRLENIKYDEPTYINGEAWKPEWEGRISKPYIMKQVTLSREINNRINLTKISGRGSVSIAETPKPENDYTLSILLDDNRYNKAQWYEFVIQSGRRDTPEKKQAKTESKPNVDATSHPKGTGNLSVRVTGKGIKAHWGVQAYPAGEKPDGTNRIESSGFELNHYVFRELKEGDYVVMAPIPFEIAGVNKATVQLNGWTRATVEPGKDIRAEIEFQENAGIRGAFQCPDKNLSWRIILLDGADKSCGSSSVEITQAHALGWKLERSGFYEINYLSPGTYTIIGRICKKGENWIPVKEKKKTVTVGDGEMAVVDFNFSSEPGDSQASRPPERSREEAGIRYQNDLNAFFSEIDKNYPFFDLKNTRGDWDRTKEHLTIQVGKCESDSEFMRIILDATKCLRDSHVRIFNNSAEIPWPKPEHYPLIGFMPAKGNTVVIMMLPPGQEGSLPVGTVVKTIDGVDARQYLDTRAKETWEAGGHPSPQRARLFAYRIPLKDVKGAKHKIAVQRQDGVEEIVLECTKEARGWPHTYNMPAKMVRVGRSFSYTKLPSGVGYMYLRRVDSSVTQGIPEAVKSHPDVRGWIVDLRGNGGGGYGSELIQMIKFLPRPVAALIDAGCMSAGETLARDIRRNAGARLFGSKTAGSSSSKRSWQFPSGIASVIIPTRSRWRADRKPIEYNGIEPDEKIEAVSGDLLKGLNTGILRAEEYILSQSSKMLETIPSAKEVAASSGNAVNKDDSSGAVITGRVLDTRGNAVPGPSPFAWIKLTQADSSGGKSDFDWTALDGAGQFKIEGIPPGSYFFEVEGIEVGYQKRAKNNPVEVSTGQVIENIEVIVETKGDPGNISGHVLDARSGKSLKEFSVKVTSVEPPGGHSSAKYQVKFDESQEGVFSIENIPPGIATLQISAPGYESEEVQLRVRSGQTRKTAFYLGGGSVQVHVTHNGKGKQGAFVKARYLGEGPGFYSRGVEDDGEGCYEIRGLREGNYLVLAGFQSVGAPVTTNSDYTLVKIEPGKTMRTNFKFQENALIRGRFTFPDNELYGRVSVLREPGEIRDDTLSESERSSGTVMYMKKDGRYEISNLPPGTYKVMGKCMAKKKGMTIGIRSRTVTLGEGKTAEVDFVFP